MNNEFSVIAGLSIFLKEVIETCIQSDSETIKFSLN